MSMEVLRVKSRRRTEFVDVTEDVKRAVETSGVASGVCYLYVPHTTAGVTSTSISIRMLRRIWKGCSSSWRRGRGLTGMPRGIRIRTRRRF